MALRSLTPVAITALPNASTPLSGTEAVAVVQSGTTSQVAVSDLTAGRAVSASALTASSGNLSFSGTAQRITGDMSNATQSNRLMFQTSTANANTSVAAIPNGTGTQAQFLAFQSSDPNNASFAQILAGVSSSDVSFRSSIAGTGTYLPMTFYTGGSERMRIDTSGNVGIGVSLSLSSGYGAGPSVNFPNQSGLLWRNNAGTWNTTTAGGAITYFSDNNLYIDAKDSTSAIIFRVNGANERMRIASTGSIVAGVGALATTATDGFIYVPTCAGTPTGTPTAITGMAPIVVDTTNNKLYFYSGGAWRDAGP